jgi:hypothetical protein
MRTLDDWWIWTGIGSLHEYMKSHETVPLSLMLLHERKKLYVVLSPGKVNVGSATKRV